MSESIIENQHTQLTNSFLTWVKNAVDSEVPVFIQKGDEQQLSSGKYFFGIPFSRIKGFRNYGLSQVG